MNTHADKTLENKVQAAGHHITKQSTRNESTVQFVDNRPATVVQQKMQEALHHSPHIQQNKTGLPNHLKEGIELLSGISMDHTRVHYNSAQPAQLNAHAYAQGNEIHLAPGQEKHLAHEAWHVVQQKQGRVKATRQMKSGVDINDHPLLEQEADVMGAKALQMKTTTNPYKAETKHSQSSTGSANVIQKKDVKKTFYEAGDQIDQLKTETDAVKTLFNTVFDAIYLSYKPEALPPSQKIAKPESVLGKRERKEPNPRAANALNSAIRIKGWSKTAYQSAARIFQELHAAQIPNGNVASIKMGINTETEPDVFVKDHTGAVHAIESKRVSSAKYAQVDVNLVSASTQLQKRHATGKYQNFQAYIVIDNPENMWPYTPSAYDKASVNHFADINEVAKKRLEDYKVGDFPITYRISWTNPQLSDLEAVRIFNIA